MPKGKNRKQKRENTRENKSQRLAKLGGIPKAVSAKIDQLRSVMEEIGKVARHHKQDVRHFRDSPARRRLEAYVNRVGVLLDLLREQAPERVPALEQEYDATVRSYL